MADERGVTLFQLYSDKCMPLAETSGPFALDRPQKSIMGALQAADIGMGWYLQVTPPLCFSQTTVLQTSAGTRSRSWGR